MRKLPLISVRARILCDLLALSLCILATQRFLFKDYGGLLANHNMLILMTGLGCWLFSARTSGLYNDFREKPFSFEWIVFLKAFVLYSLLITCILFLFFHEYLFSRRLVIFHCSLLFVLVPFQKLFFRMALKRLRNSDNVKRKVLIVGAGDTGIRFYQKYVKDLHYGFELTGFVDDQKHPSLNGHYLGKTTEIEKVIARYDLDDIIVTLPSSEENKIERIVSIGEKEGKRIRIIPDYERFGGKRLRLDQIGSFPVITLRHLPLDISDNRYYKRLFDIAFSVLVIVFIFSWLFPLIALLIKWGSKGPVFFKQERWGLNNKPILCYKFRSMVATSTDVDEKGRYRQATRNDPRVTPIGRFLRKTNLDELPQFFNVLLGSMSVVGPRPHPVPLNLQSKDSVDNYMMRHWVKPGITGWAQVKGYRGETSTPHLMQKRVELDMWYMENWTFPLDLQIIVQTLVNMVKGEENAL
ncbi:undecaprenyl-phosphate glucose phosphotransferase [Paraflavisolibacter sp. H34]|uniref:undecaprenyl-phosphate glucose phosphotransferase n=1 Tax=Huijunlia imazamoxiresistens TaxID=3127457 RepID=UPI00301878D6